MEPCGVKIVRQDGFLNRQTCIVFNDPMQNIITYKCISKNIKMWKYNLYTLHKLQSILGK